MKHLMLTGAAIVLLGIGAPRVEAQAVASSFEQLSVLVKPGDRITLVDVAGTETDGRIGLLTRDRLTLLTPAGPRNLSESDVEQIRQRRGDSLRNGAIIGAAAGAGYGLAMLAITAAYSDGGGVIPSGVVSGMVLFTGLGAAAGVGIDALITRRQVIYRARPGESRFTVSPMLGGGRRGAAVTVRF
jgi:hypothetical protein